MELRDFIVTPLILILVFWGAHIVRPWVTDDVTRKYFFPALWVRVFGALAVGFIYQFYYDGGDTFNYHTHGSRHIWEAFAEDPFTGLKVLFSDGNTEGIYRYTSRIWYYNDPHSFFVVRVASFFDLLTFSTYSATAVFFALVSFTGCWLMFKTFYGIASELHRWAAISCLFIPTVFFWGSGIFKDTLSLAFLGVALYCTYQIFVARKISFIIICGLILSIWVVFSIKKYILLCFLPAVLFYFFSILLSRVKSLALKMIVVPIAIVPVLLLVYVAVSKVGEDDPRYDVTKLARTAQITAYDIRFGWGARTGEGAGYTLGELDGAWQSLARLAPAAVVVSLFRPYVWEVSNPLMALSALESLAFLLLTLYVLYKSGPKIFMCLKKPEVILCLGFSIVFAFAVGVSTFNFGTLSRYKIPLLPFYAMGLGFLYYYSNRDRKTDELETTE